MKMTYDHWQKIADQICGPHSATWFIVIASLLIRISNTGTITMGLYMYISDCLINYRSCPLSVHEQTIIAKYGISQ